MDSQKKALSSRPEASQSVPFPEAATRAAVEGPSPLTYRSEEREVTLFPEASPPLPAQEKDPSPNPLFDLPARQKDLLSDLLRSGSELEVINDQLTSWDLEPATRPQIDEFFRIHSKDRWTRRLDLAAQEADTIMALVRQTSGQIPDAVLAALGQIAFSKIASGQVESGDLTKFTALFLRAREQDRAERALDLQNENSRLARRNATEKALDAFARELPQNPAALAAFQNLKNQLLDQTEHLEDESL